jgi:ATP-binding cassette subfamily F protein uup
VKEKKVEEAPKPKKRKLSYQEQRDWDTIEERIAKLEETVEQLAAELEAAGADYERAQQLAEEQQRAEQELEAAIERWSELSELVEGLKS